MVNRDCVNTYICMAPIHMWLIVVVVVVVVVVVAVVAVVVLVVLVVVVAVVAVVAVVVCGHKVRIEQYSRDGVYAWRGRVEWSGEERTPVVRGGAVQLRRSGDGMHLKQGQWRVR